jgi:AcrR family transcriptional regulator
MLPLSTSRYDVFVSTYHHGNLRPALVSAAVELARVNGPDGVVLREVARQTGVSHNAAYRHFADREELLAEVASVAMDQLEQAMEQRINAVKSRSAALKARRRLSEVGRAYVYFALAEPGQFEVAFASKQPHDPTSRPVDSGPYRVLGDALDELVDAGVLTKARREGADVVCWAAVHGFATLHLRGPLREMPPELREVTLGLLLATIERGLTSA